MYINIISCAICVSMTYGSVEYLCQGHDRISQGIWETGVGGGGGGLGITGSYVNMRCSHSLNVLKICH